MDRDIFKNARDSIIKGEFETLNYRTRKALDHALNEASKKEIRERPRSMGLSLDQKQYYATLRDTYHSFSYENLGGDVYIHCKLHDLTFKDLCFKCKCMSISNA